jgi:LPXTG-motif cell wall-anchored protein
LYTGSLAGTYAPGASVGGSFAAAQGYVFQGNAGPFSHTYWVTGAPCQLQNNPLVELNAVCASWNTKFTNPVDGIDPWESVPDAGFDLVVDGITEHITVPANATETRNGSFPEDSGDHTVTIGQHTVTVKTDCEPNEILPPILTASYDCVSQTSAYLLDPAEDGKWIASEVVLEGNTYSVVITPNEGYTFGEGANEDGTLTLTATFVVTTDCVIPPPALTAGYDCVSQKSAPVLTPPSSQHWTAGAITLAGNTYSVTVTPNQGFRFADPGTGGTVTLTATFTVTTGCEHTAAAPQVTPPTCSAPGTVVLPASDHYTWRTNDDGTFTAVPNEGVRLIGTTTFGPFDIAQLTGEECVIPTIDLAAFSPVCQGDTPYIQYEVKVSGTTANDATLTFYDLDGRQVARYVDVPLSGRVIYPGASLDPPDWPGWKLNSAGLWEIDSSDSRLRDGLTVTVEVNPTATANVAYPPATQACSDPDQVESQAPTTTVQLVQLPSTGSGSGRIAGVGGLLLLAGGAMVLLVRRPRPA